MKIVKLLVVMGFYIGFYANAQSVTPQKKWLNDTISFKAKKLQQLYLLSTAVSVYESDNYKQQFFYEFPKTFKLFNELYGYDNIRNKPGPLSTKALEHINLFNGLVNINDSIYYKKIVSIAIGGLWDEDAVGFFQEGLRSRVLTNPKLTVYILKTMNDIKIRSFWLFYFDGPVVRKQISEPLQTIKEINSRIYNLMIEGHEDALKLDK